MKLFVQVDDKSSFQYIYVDPKHSNIVCNYLKSVYFEDDNYFYESREDAAYDDAEVFWKVTDHGGLFGYDVGNITSKEFKAMFSVIGFDIVEVKSNHTHGEEFIQYVLELNGDN